MLTDEEREVFAEIAKGKRGRLNIAVWKVQRTNAMLKCDESEHGPAWSDQRIADAFSVTARVRKLPQTGRRAGAVFP